MTSQDFPAMEEAGERIRQAPHLLLSVIFDGALTPIVDDPAHALLPAPTKTTLAALGRRRDVAVAVVSGRGVAELQDLVGIPEVICAGNHGMEIRGPGIDFVEPAAYAASRDLHALAADLAGKLRQVHGILVEDKGLSISVHYRRVAPMDGEEVWHTVHHAVADFNDRFHITLGEKVYEIRPLVRWTKAAAVRWIKNHLGRVGTLMVYVGTESDEDAFCALDNEAISIRVGDSADSAAQFLLPDSDAVERLLCWIGGRRDEKRRLGSAIAQTSV